MTDFLLGSSTKLLTVAIRVKDRDQAIAFYRDVLGFELKKRQLSRAMPNKKRLLSKKLVMKRIN